VVRDPRRHGWRHPQRLVNPTEVVVHEVQRDGSAVILDLLGEGVGQAGEPTHGHPHGQVLALDVAG